LQPDGTLQWQIDLGSVSHLTVHGSRLYAAGWDGWLRSFDDTGKLLWKLNCTPPLNPDNPVAALAASPTAAIQSVWQARREPTTSADVPSGKNLLADGEAKLTVGGTGGWMSEGKVQVRAEDLTNGKTDDVDTPWLHVDELFWDGTAGRQVWAEITFAQPTDVGSITVYENPRQPDSWPTEGLIQVWNEAQKRWDTAAFGVFLHGPVNTFRLQLQGVQKLRYAPWNSYYRNFYTSEIEVRGPN
jgi:hypothetical protein